MQNAVPRIVSLEIYVCFALMNQVLDDFLVTQHACDLERWLSIFVCLKVVFAQAGNLEILALVKLIAAEVDLSPVLDQSFHDRKVAFHTRFV